MLEIYLKFWNQFLCLAYFFIIKFKLKIHLHIWLINNNQFILVSRWKVLVLWTFSISINCALNWFCISVSVYEAHRTLSISFIEIFLRLQSKCKLNNMRSSKYILRKVNFTYPSAIYFRNYFLKLNPISKSHT